MANQTLKSVMSEILILCFIVLYYGSTDGRELTAEVGPRERSCFYHVVTDLENAQFELEYQVIEGGDMDINFVVNSPSDQVLLSEQRKTEGVHKVKPTHIGDFRFCFDNTFSSFSSKLVFFELTSKDDNEDEKDWSKLTAEDNLIDVKLEDFRTTMDNVKKSLDKSSQIQNILRAYETRDRSIQESNFDRVNFWSAVHLVVMITVAITQVVMVRGLLDEKSRFHQIFKSSPGGSSSLRT